MKKDSSICSVWWSNGGRGGFTYPSRREKINSAAEDLTTVSTWRRTGPLKDLWAAHNAPYKGPRGSGRYYRFSRLMTHFLCSRSRVRSCTVSVQLLHFFPRRTQLTKCSASSRVIHWPGRTEAASFNKKAPRGKLNSTKWEVWEKNIGPS